MKSLILFTLLVASFILFHNGNGAAIDNQGDETSVHFDFKTENGHQRVEDITFNKTSPASKNGANDITSEKPVEIRGGYSFISADGYEYTVKYKANKNGFQPYVTAHKLKETA